MGDWPKITFNEQQNSRFAVNSLTVIVDEGFFEVPAPCLQAAQRIVRTGAGFRYKLCHQLRLHHQAPVLLSPLSAT